MKGVAGRYAMVDLSRRIIEDYSIPSEWYEKFLGGRGVGARILLEETTGQEEALEPENVMVFATGPFQGSGFGGAGRHAIISRSPKTNSLSDTYAGGYFGHELGRSGYDGLIIRGRADRPTYLACIDGGMKLVDASSLWGAKTSETERTLRERYPGARVTSIGKAGENLVPFACLINDGGRAAGRPGFGAVMGSKNLKAIVVKGSLPRSCHLEEGLKSLRKKMALLLLDDVGRQERALGTARLVEPLNAMGILPTENFREGVFDDVAKLGDAAYSQMLVGRETCTGCPIGCKNLVKTSFAGQEVDGAGPEYEAIAALGSLCMNGNLAAVALANQKCNEYGLDVISTGITIAYAMEASEKGLLKGSSVVWGDSGAIVDLIGDIASRQGLGALLSRGVIAAADEIGLDSALVVKGQEVAMHDPRGKVGFGLSLATCPLGGHHTQGMHDHVFENTPVAEELGIQGTVDPLSFEGQPSIVKTYEDLMSFTNACILCRFTSFNRAGKRYLYPLIRQALFAITGHEIDAKKMLQIGERGYLLLRLAAYRAGYRRSDDALPERLMSPQSKGPLAGVKISDQDFNHAIDKYYIERGYEADGKPSKERLEELGCQVPGWS